VGGDFRRRLRISFCSSRGWSGSPLELVVGRWLSLHLVQPALKWGAPASPLGQSFRRPTDSVAGAILQKCFAQACHHDA